MGGSGGNCDGTKDVINGLVERLGRLTAQDQSSKVVAENVELPQVLLFRFAPLECRQSITLSAINEWRQVLPWAVRYEPDPVRYGAWKTWSPCTCTAGQA